MEGSLLAKSQDDETEIIIKLPLVVNPKIKNLPTNQKYYNIKNMFEIDSKVIDNVVVFKLEGDFNLEACQPFKTEADKYLELGYNTFLIDFEKLKFILSMGFREIIILYKKLGQQSQGKIVFCSMSPSVKKSYELLSLDTLFDYFNSCASAISTLK